MQPSRKVDRDAQGHFQTPLTAHHPSLFRTLRSTLPCKNRGTVIMCNLLKFLHSLGCLHHTLPFPSIPCSSLSAVNHTKWSPRRPILFLSKISHLLPSKCSNCSCSRSQSLLKYPCNSVLVGGALGSVEVKYSVSSGTQMITFLTRVPR